MSRHLIVGPAAEQDIAEAITWYIDHAPVQAERLLDELNSMMTRVRESPKAFRTVHAEVRRAALRVFPYLVWFVFDEDADRVQVLAVTHHRRDPAAVRARLGD